jgi:hypothetical protein
MPAISAGIAIGGLALSAYAAHKQGKAAEKAGEAGQDAANDAAAILDFNAAVADLQAADAVKRGTVNAGLFRQKVRQVQGGQRTSFAGQNVDVGTGSAADVQADSAYLGEIDAIQVEQNAALEAWGYKTDAYNSRRKAVVTRKGGAAALAEGRANKSAAYLQGTANVLTGAGQLANRYGWGEGA